MIKGDLLKDGAQADDLNLKVNTLDYFEKAFLFQDMKHFDYSTEQLNNLEAAQKNLNDNLDNEKLYDKFIATANEVKKNLQEKYGDKWDY